MSIIQKANKFFGALKIQSPYEFYDNAYQLARLGKISNAMGMLWLCNVHHNIDFDEVFYRIIRGYLEYPNHTPQRLKRLVLCTVRDNDSMLSEETNPVFLLQTTASDKDLIDVLTIINDTNGRLASNLQDPDLTKWVSASRRKRIEKFVETHFG